MDSAEAQVEAQERSLALSMAEEVPAEEMQPHEIAMVLEAEPGLEATSA
jgi:hypothetical protein